MPVVEESARPGHILLPPPIQIPLHTNIYIKGLCSKYMLQYGNSNTGIEIPAFNTGPVPLVFLPGFVTPTTYYGHFVQQLEALSYGRIKTTILDTRKRSLEGKGASGFADYLGYLLDEVREKHIESTVLGGHSLGGTVAILAAEMADAALNGGSAAFISYMMGLDRVPWKRQREYRDHLEGLLEYFTFQNFFSTRTLFQGVRTFPPGCIMRLSVDAPTPEWTRYWYFLAMGGLARVRGIVTKRFPPSELHLHTLHAELELAKKMAPIMHGLSYSNAEISQPSLVYIGSRDMIFPFREEFVRNLLDKFENAYAFNLVGGRHNSGCSLTPEDTGLPAEFIMGNTENLEGMVEAQIAHTQERGRVLEILDGKFPRSDHPTTEILQAPIGSGFPVASHPALELERRLAA